MTLQEILAKCRQNKAWRIERLFTHDLPHLDELLAIRLLRRHGNEMFPGVREAELLFNYDGEAPEGKNWEQHFMEGTLLIGTGGGPFDEHPTSAGAERKEAESACSLVAKVLGLEKHPIYKQMIALITECDNAGVHKLHAANCLKRRYRNNPDNQQIGIDFALDVLDDWEEEQRKFLDAQELLHSLCNTDCHLKIHGPSDDLDLVVVESGNPAIGAAARSLRIAVVIQKQPNGHVQIFTNTEAYGFEMKFVVEKIRQAEMKQAGLKNGDKLSADYLQRQGKIAEVKNWFFQVPGNNLLNGSETTPATPITKIPLERIVKIVANNVFVEAVHA